MKWQRKGKKVEYCIRLDDACPQMNAEKWARIERILDKYKVRPIVGVIPENRDPDFVAVADENFWEKACEWQKKGWTIALHGLHHELHFHEPRGYYQLSHSSKTEWAGKSSTEQYEMLKQGYQILKGHGLTPTCFFAPCHTYDEATVEAIASMKTEECPCIFRTDMPFIRTKEMVLISCRHFLIRPINFHCRVCIHLSIILIICRNKTLHIWKTS